MLDPKEVSAEDGRRYLEDQNSPRYVIVKEKSRLLCSDLWDGGYVQTGWEALKTLKDLKEYSDSSEWNRPRKREKKNERSVRYHEWTPLFLN